MRGCNAAYYLIHSMLAAGFEYSERDRELAEIFARAAEIAGCKRIIYLGGLGETGSELSEHLSSRREVESALASRSVPVTVLRAAMIIGSGSSSFETLRFLVERLPMMITPRLVSTESQPIAVDNVLVYLVSCLETPATIGRVLDIGGPDILSYREIMAKLAEALGLPRRWVIPAPRLTPRLSSLWIHLVTPMSHRIARPLAEGLRNRVVCRSDGALRLMPQRLLSIREAIEAALGMPDDRRLESQRSDAVPIPGDPVWAGSTTFVNRFETEAKATQGQLFRAVCLVCDHKGWLAADGSDSSWRIIRVKPTRSLVLRAEGRMPGELVVEIEVQSNNQQPDTSRLVWTRRFSPRGLAGLAYGYTALRLYDLRLRAVRRTIYRMAAGEVRAESVAEPERQVAGSISEALSIDG